MRRAVICAALFAALAPFCGAPAHAQVTPSPAPTCLIPFVFSPYTVANANQVNSNFTALQTCIDSVLVGAGYPTLQCTGLVTCAPNSGATPGIGVATPNPVATSTGCGTLAYSGSYPNYTLTGTFTGCGLPQTTPSPNATSTTVAGSPSCTFTGSYPYTLNCNFPQAGGGGGSGITLQTAASPSPQGGYAALSGAQLWDNPSGSLTGLYIGPNPTPTPLYDPDAIMVTEGQGAGGCAGNNRAAWGTTSSTINSVAGVMFAVSCAAIAGGPWLTVDAHGNLGVYSTVYPDAAGNGTAMVLQAGDNLIFTGASSNVNNCVLAAKTGWGALQLANSGGGTCSLALTDLAPSTEVCTNTSANHTELTNCFSGQVVCAVSSGSACSATASPVPTALNCTASYDATATTVSPAPGDLVPLMVKVTGSVLTVYMGTTTNLTGNIAADYKC